jgi:hypothetical protein
MTTSDPFLQTVGLVASGIVVLAGCVAFAILPKTMMLDYRWPLLVWSHYRHIIGRVASKARPYGHLDFVTHQGVDFQEQLGPHGAPDLMYGPCADSECGMVICDIESIDSMEKSLITTEGKSLAALSLLLKKQAFIDPLLMKRLDELNIREKAVPLRWGFNSLAVKVDNPATQEWIRAKYLGSSFSGLDLGDFLVNPQNELRAKLLEDIPFLPLVTLEWFLPPMMLIFSDC